MAYLMIVIISIILKSMCNLENLSFGDIYFFIWFLFSCFVATKVDVNVSPSVSFIDFDIHACIVVLFWCQRSEGGLFIDMNTFLAFGKDCVAWNYEKTGNKVYLHIKQTKKVVAEDRPLKKPTLLGIGTWFVLTLFLLVPFSWKFVIVVYGGMFGLFSYKCWILLQQVLIIFCAIVEIFFINIYGIWFHLQVLMGDLTTVNLNMKKLTL